MARDWPVMAGDYYLFAFRYAVEQFSEMSFGLECAHLGHCHSSILNQPVVDQSTIDRPRTSDPGSSWTSGPGPDTTLHAPESGGARRGDSFAGFPWNRLQSWRNVGEAGIADQ